MIPNTIDRLVPLRLQIDNELLAMSLKDVLGFDLSPAAETPNEFRFNHGSGAAWRPCDSDASDIVFGRSIADRIKKPFRQRVHARKSGHTGIALECDEDTLGIVVFPRDNTQVVVSRSSGEVCKMARQSGGALDSLGVEAEAARLVPLHAPSVKKRASPEDHRDYLVTDYVEDAYPVGAKEWRSVFGSCLGIIERCSQEHRPTAKQIGEMTQDWKEQVPEGADSSKFNRESLLVLQQVEQYLQPHANQTIQLSFAHGDLTRPNVRRPSQAELILIDWGNGGVRPLLFDIVVHEFYLESKNFWSSVRSAKSVEEWADAGFGRLIPHARAVFDIAGITFDLETLRLHLMSSLFVLVASNRRRYLSHDEREGIQFFKHIDRVVGWTA